jgi:hypothetical protein
MPASLPTPLRPVALLPCASCGRPGPNHPVPDVAGGWTALCAGCEAQPDEDARQDSVDALDFPTSR